jgi:Skp family chaperone for outer membrane proteins
MVQKYLRLLTDARWKKLVIIGVLCSILLFASCALARSISTSTAEVASASGQQLQVQIDDLTNMISAYNNVISQLQSQIKTLQTAAESETKTSSTTSPTNQQISNEIDTLKTSISKLTPVVTYLQSQVAALQASLQAAETTIGTSFITVNGLSVVFITNDVDIGVTGPTTPSVAQFAVKIINTTSSAVTNIDVTGTITSSRSFSGTVAAGYPQLVDGAGLCSYACFHGGSNVLHFEAYSGGKTTLTIPAGGSITIRPKLSILATANNQLPPIAFVLALKTITYDVVPKK